MSVQAPHPLAELTVEAWADLQEDDPGELVDGRLEEEEMPTTLHESVISFLMFALTTWARSRGARVFASELKLIVGARRGRKPDLSVYFATRALPGKGKGATRRPPSLVVEVLSPRPRDVRRDTVEKLGDYAAFGVTFYWIVDPLARTLEIRELHADGRHVTMLAVAEGKHAVPGCDGLELDLDELWADLDGLPDEEDEVEG